MGRVEKKLIAVIDAMPYGVALWRSTCADAGSTRLIYANAQCGAHSGTAYAPMVGKQLREIFPNWDGNSFPLMLVRVAETSTSQTLYDIPYGDDVNPHGWFKVSLIPLGDGYVGSIYENVTIKRRLEQRLKQMALEDQLTNLYNRRGFRRALREALERAERAGKMVAVLFCDLDKFKEVNDAFGHETGDIALKAVGERLVATVRKVDKVARLGGDEFGIVLEGIEREEDVKTVAQKIIDVISQNPWYLGGRRQASLGISVGISLAVSADEDLDLILQHADAAMYKAKETGNIFVFHNGLGGASR